MSELAKNSSQRSDSDLVAAIAAGDRQALEQLYLSYHRRLSRFLSRVTQRYENVEEVINDTFFVVWQKAGEFRSASRVSTWIFGIAYRTTLNSIRRQKNHTAALSLDESPEQSIEPLVDAEMEDWVMQGLSQLSAEQRLTLELAYHMGHSAEEIALITGSPLGTVKTRMYYARQKLREYLPVLGGDAPKPPTNVQ